MLRKYLPIFFNPKGITIIASEKTVVVNKSLPRESLDLKCSKSHCKLKAVNLYHGKKGTNEFIRETKCYPPLPKKDKK